LPKGSTNCQSIKTSINLSQPGQRNEAFALVTLTVTENAAGIAGGKDSIPPQPGKVSSTKLPYYASFVMFYFSIP